MLVRARGPAPCLGVRLLGFPAVPPQLRELGSRSLHTSTNLSMHQETGGWEVTVDHNEPHPGTHVLHTQAVTEGKERNTLQHHLTAPTST